MGKKGYAHKKGLLKREMSWAEYFRSLEKYFFYPLFHILLVLFSKGAQPSGDVILYA